MSMSALGSGGIRLPSYAREQAQTPRRQTPPGLLAQEDPVKVGNVCAAKGHPSASEIASVGKCESSTSAMVHPDDDVEMEDSRSPAGGGDGTSSIVSRNGRTGLSLGKNADIWALSDFGSSIETSPPSDVCSLPSDRSFCGGPIVSPPSLRGEMGTSQLQSCSATTTATGRVGARDRGVDCKGGMTSCSDVRDRPDFLPPPRSRSASPEPHIDGRGNSAESDEHYSVRGESAFSTGWRWGPGGRKDKNENDNSKDKNDDDTNNSNNNINDDSDESNNNKDNSNAFNTATAATGLEAGQTTLRLLQVSSDDNGTCDVDPSTLLKSPPQSSRLLRGGGRSSASPRGCHPTSTGCSPISKAVDTSATAGSGAANRHHRRNDTTRIHLGLLVDQPGGGVALGGALGARGGACSAHVTPQGISEMVNGRSEVSTSKRARCNRSMDEPLGKWRGGGGIDHRRTTSDSSGRSEDSNDKSDSNGRYEGSNENDCGMDDDACPVLLSSMPGLDSGGGTAGRGPSCASSPFGEIVSSGGGDMAMASSGERILTRTRALRSRRGFADAASQGSKYDGRSASLAVSPSALLMRGLSLNESGFSDTHIDSAIGDHAFTMDREPEQNYEDDTRFHKISGGQEKCSGGSEKTDGRAKVDVFPPADGNISYDGVTDVAADGHDTTGSGGSDGGGHTGNSGLVDVKGRTREGGEDDAEVEIGDVTGRVVEVWKTNGGRRGPRCISVRKTLMSPPARRGHGTGVRGTAHV